MGKPAKTEYSKEEKDAINHFATVGMIATAWAHIENLIDVATLELAKIPKKEGLCLTAQVIGPARKLDAYFSVARLRKVPDKYLKKLNHTVQQTHRLSERRNRVIHDSWDISGETPKRLEISARKILKLEQIGVSTRELQSLALEIQAHFDDFRKLHQEILVEVGKLPDE